MYFLPCLNKDDDDDDDECIQTFGSILSVTSGFCNSVSATPKRRLSTSHQPSLLSFSLSGL